MNTILTQAQWNLLEQAEAPLYANSHGFHSFTSVRDREDSGALAAMWADAESSVEMITDDPDEVQSECATRVALAQALLIFGPEVYGAEDGGVA